MTCYDCKHSCLTPLFCLVREALTNMKKSLDQEIVDLKQKIQELRERQREVRGRLSHY